jgi:hypothetical protein
MRWMLMLGMLMAVLRAATATAQPADCLTAPSTGPMLPLSLDLAGRHGVPSGVSGQAYVAVPMEAPGIACAILPPPLDVLRGPPSDVLRGARGNLLNPAPQ